MSSRRRSAIAGLAASVWLACGTKAPQSPPTATVERARIERIVVATGTIEPEGEVEVRPRIPGIIEKIHVSDGDRVEARQPLIEIESELLAAQVREATAALEQAGVEAHFAEIDLGRSNELERGGAASQRKRDDALSRQRQGRAAVAQARARLDRLETRLSYATVRAARVPPSEALRAS